MTLPDVFALLDDRGATPERPSSRLYTGFVREHRCVSPAELDATWARIDADQRAGLHAVLLADYEWGAKLVGAGTERLAADDAAALRALLFSERALLSADEVGAWLQQTGPVPGAAGAMNLEPSVDRAEFTQAIDRIHEAIKAGETYQVNHTYRLHGQVHGTPLDLYRRLRARQPVAYGALIALPPGGAEGTPTHVLSCSPELFLRHEAGVLTARPMKGTARRVDVPEGDSETARHLSLDVKNRAENLMIVDLLRNDLGRVAETGSVQVPDLFTIEHYPTLFQMTSTVQARLKPGVGMAELLRAVFPCGSITGAPKHHTMGLIAGLESTPRGLYCGAIGWADAPRGQAAVGNFCLSVAIRTLTLGAEAGTRAGTQAGTQERGLRPVRLGIGAGIVLDSRAADEFDECRLKARFLTSIDPGFELFETLLALPGSGVRHLDRHLARLAHSAQVFGFGFDGQAARRAIQACVQQVAVPQRVRLALAHDGSLQARAAPLLPLPDSPVGLIVAEHRLPVANPLAAHKTTLRQHYDDGVRAAEQVGAFDSLFFNSDGWLVEGGRSSVFVRIDGRWCTPPLTDGALPGVMRALVLQDPAWQAAERSVSLGDLQRAEALMVCNALRGPLPARVVRSPA